MIFLKGLWSNTLVVLVSYFRDMGVKWRQNTTGRQQTIPVRLPLCCCWLIWPIQNLKKTYKKGWNPVIWVLIWEYSARALQWIPTWQGLDDFQKSLCPCVLNRSSFSIGRVNPAVMLRLLLSNVQECKRMGKFVLTKSCGYSKESSRWIVLDEYPFDRVSVNFHFVLHYFLYWPN